MKKWKCLLCEKEGMYQVLHKKVRDSDDFSITKCINCNHIQLSPLPTLLEEQNFYNHDLQAKNTHEQKVDVEKMRKNACSDVRRRMAFLKDLAVTKDHKILEIGTGYGFFVQAMEQEGYMIEGIEVSRERRNIARTVCESKIYETNVLSDEILPKAKKYDIVVSFQVLEHIIYPEKFLSKIGKLLRRHGTLIIEVPNANDHLLDCSKEYHDFFWQRAHVSYFSPEGLKYLLAKSGFNNIKVQGIQRYSIENMMHWLIVGKPQLQLPSYEVSEKIKWLDDIYRQKICDELRSDTLIAVVLI